MVLYVVQMYMELIFNGEFKFITIDENNDPYAVNANVICRSYFVI